MYRWRLNIIWFPFALPVSRRCFSPACKTKHTVQSSQSVKKCRIFLYYICPPGGKRIVVFSCMTTLLPASWWTCYSVGWRARWSGDKVQFWVLEMKVIVIGLFLRFAIYLYNTSSLYAFMVGLRSQQFLTSPSASPLICNSLGPRFLKTLADMQELTLKRLAAQRVFGVVTWADQWSLTAELPGRPWKTILSFLGFGEVSWANS